MVKTKRFLSFSVLRKDLLIKPLMILKMLVAEVMKFKIFRQHITSWHFLNSATVFMLLN